MSISRFIFSSSKHRLAEAPNLIQRFCQCKRIQCRYYTNSSSQSNGKPRRNPVMTTIENPTPQSWGTYAIPAALLTIAGLAGLVRYNDERRSVPKGQGDNNPPCTNLKGPAIGGQFSLIDTEHRLVTDKTFLGNWVLLYFGYTSSPDVGPEQLKLIAKAVNIIDSKQNLKILPVFVTLDPQRDSPSQLRVYLRDFDSRIVGLTGPVDAIKNIAREYRVFFRKVEEDKDDYLVESSHNMYLLNPNMEVVRCFGIEYNADQLSESILQEMKRTTS